MRAVPLLPEIIIVVLVVSVLVGWLEAIHYRTKYLRLPFCVAIAGTLFAGGAVIWLLLYD